MNRKVPGENTAPKEAGPPHTGTEGGAADEAYEELRTENENLKKASEELNQRCLRLAADFDNFRKRTARQTEENRQFALEKFAVELLEVADNFERALKADDASLREGLESIRKEFTGILEKHGVNPIECVNRDFNPEEHEAVACIPSDHPEGTVVEEFIRGYCMHDKVIRHAKVAVSKGKQ
ncbi:nucleotide exchange factor GrpE [Methanofollis formosanus]|uniref:Protein GrpE n=1 Tax=Methanofollis formosanus TaxID=299308 RepID=A0A8G0ZW21_9EURY|nr:nucleotide exchange factor GrpE [Methanofollis formosanus]QYZ77944.1 nucleotide exchange factor GrpE [Methanofollis formosanus]